MRVPVKSTNYFHPKLTGHAHGGAVHENFYYTRNTAPLSPDLSQISECEPSCLGSMSAVYF
jgi:hypothetical protein